MDGDKTIRKLVSVTFADIKGYTAITAKDESKAFETIEAFKKIVDECVAFYSGEIIKDYGDGVLIIHESVIDSINCAIKMQLGFQDSPKIPVKIGIHFGDIILSKDNVYGDAVNIASRIQDLAEEESVLVSDKVCNEIKNHPEIKSSFISEEYLKNVKHKVGIYAINHSGLKIPNRELVHEKAFKPKKSTSFVFKLFAFILFFSALFAIYNIVGGSIKFTPNTAAAEKVDVKVLSVFPFKNFTGDSTLNELGLITSYKLISSLKISDNIKLVDYSNISDKKKIQEFKFFNSKKFTNETGASHVINGEVYLSNDTLVYHSRLQSLKNNNIVQEFETISCSKENKLEGIDALANKIKGYLAVQESNKPFLRNPTYEAYKHSVIGWDFYYEGQDELAIKTFEKSIESDSSFLDPYLAIMDVFYYRKKYREASALYDLIIKKFPLESLSDRERNMLKYDKSIISGNNKSAYEAFELEYAYNPYFLENNTTHLINSRRYINNPDKALEILKSIKLSNFDFNLASSGYHIHRLNIAIWAYALKNQLNKAKDIIKYYPSKAANKALFETQLLLYTKLNDTLAINETLFNAGLANYNNSKYLEYWVAHLFALQGKSKLKEIYAERALVNFHAIKSGSYYIGCLYLLQEEYEKALQYFEEYLIRKPKSRYALAMKGVSYAKLDEIENAENCISKLKNLNREYDRGFIAYYQAVIYSVIGNKEKAIKLIDQSLKEGKEFNYLIYDFDPFLDNLKDDPQFQSIIHPKLN